MVCHQLSLHLYASMSEVSSVPSRPQSPVATAPNNYIPPPQPYRFTWDPASRRPGPESVSGTTDGRGVDDFGGPHPPLGVFNNSTTSLALESLPTEWSSSRTGFHGISLPSFLYYMLVNLMYSSYIYRTEQPS